MTANGTVFPYGPNVGSEFRLPDLKDRYLMSPTWSNNNPGPGYVATAGGTNQHSHTAAAKPTNAELSVSIPLGGAHNHTWNANVSTSGAHTHTGGYSVGAPLINSNVKRAGGGNQTMATGSHSHGGNFTANSAGDHSHGISAPNTSVTTNSHSHSISTSVNTNTTNSGNHNPLALRVFYMVYSGVAE